jgi:hypothetical protein
MAPSGSVSRRQRVAQWRKRLGLPVCAPQNLARVTTLLLGWLSASMWQAAWLPGLPPHGTPEGAAAVLNSAAWLARSVRYLEEAAAVSEACAGHATV